MICGQNLNVKGLTDHIDSIKTQLTAGMDMDASALKTELSSNIDTLVTKLRSLVPEMPAIPAVSFQTELDSLMSITDTGSNFYLTKLADISTKFGSALTTAGGDLNTIISGVSSGSLDICGSVPNLELPSGAITAIEKASPSLKPQVKAAKEELSTLVRNENTFSIKEAAEKLNAEWTATPDDSSTVFDPIEKTSTMVNKFGQEIEQATSNDMIKVIKTSEGNVETITTGLQSSLKKTKVEAITTSVVSGGGTVERSKGNYNKKGIAARKKSIRRVYYDIPDKEILDSGKSLVSVTIPDLNNEILDIPYVAAYVNNKRVPARLRKTEVIPAANHAFAGKAWPYYNVVLGGTEPVIEIFNLDNITKVRIRGLKNSTYDPRQKKQTKSEMTDPGMDV